jgi:MOSC domain-containing protein
LDERAGNRNNQLPYLASIQIYPVKSLEPVSLQQVRVLASGALEGDRSFAVIDAEGKFVNGKRNAKVHRLRSAYDPLTSRLRLGRAETGLTACFHLNGHNENLDAWLSEFFGTTVQIRHNEQVGFPDDLDCPGPTVISTATLAEVASWMRPLDTRQVRLRFRANLEIGGVPPFWEDRLYGVKDSLVRFRIGDCLFDGNNPCRRCAVPPRDPLTGENHPEFSQIFRRQREKTLPAWAEKSRFDHFYRLAVNTRVPPGQAGKTISVGDEIEILA